MKKTAERICGTTAKCRLLAAILSVIAVLSFGFGMISAGNHSADASVKTVLSYFTGEGGVTLTPGQDTPDYVDKAANGLLVETPSLGKVTYNNEIDVNKLKTGDDLNVLLELQITPRVAGADTTELDQLIVRMFDAEDPKYFVDISLYRYVYSDALRSRFVHVAAKPYTTETWYAHRYSDTGYTMNYNIQQATMVDGPFGGRISSNGSTASNSIRLYYDAADKALYVANEGATDPEKQLYMVVNMDDAADMGSDRSVLFNGFPSGKIKLSISAEKVTADTARYMILTIDDQHFDGEKLNDVTPPDMTIDLQGYDKEQLPQAQVGKAYPFFDASSVDKMYGERPVRVVVKKGDSEIYHLGKSFVPTEAGEYTIEYLSSDDNYNVASERFTVTASNTLDEITGTLDVKDGDYNLTDDSLKEGEFFKIPLYFAVNMPSVTATGGSGRVDAELRVFVNGKSVPVENNSFVPVKSGEYTIEYVLTDYIGNTQIMSYKAKVGYSDVPRIVEPNLPDYALVGREILLPAPVSEYYTVWNQRVATFDTITVSKADGTLIQKFTGSTAQVFKPLAEHGNEIKVTYASAKSENAETSEYTKTIKILSSDKLEDRFVKSEGVTLEADFLSLDYKFTADGQQVEFINPMTILGGVAVEFAVPKDANNFGNAFFTFTDSADKNTSITVRFHKNASDTATTSRVTVDGGEELRPIGASFYGNVINDFTFTLYNDGTVLDGNGDTVARALNFGGFKSGKVLLTFGADDCGAEDSGDKTIQLKQLQNQVIGDQDTDYIKPVLTIENDPAGTSKLGTTVEASPALATDVFDEKVTLKLVVKFNGNVIYEEEDGFGRVKGTTFFAYDYGTYTMEYTATDVTGNVSTRSYSVLIRDNTAPTLRIDGEMPTAVKSGEDFKFPNVYVTDNVDVNLPVYVVIIDPMNVYTVIELGESFKATLKGRYVVKFYCEDACYNTTYSEEFRIICE